MESKAQVVDSNTSAVNRLLAVNNSLAADLLQENALAKMMNSLVETRVSIGQLDLQVEMIRDQIREQEAQIQEALQAKQSF